MATRVSKSLLTHTRRWYLLNAQGQPVGRLAAQVAQLLQGKTKPIYDPSTLCGDNVVLTNTKDVAFSGRKWDQKLYRHHTGYPGGFREVLAKNLHEKKPTQVIRNAVYGMLPKNKLRKQWMRQLYLFEDSEHPHVENLHAELYGPVHAEPPLPTLYKIEEVAGDSVPLPPGFELGEVQVFEWKVSK